MNDQLEQLHSLLSDILLIPPGQLNSDTNLKALQSWDSLTLVSIVGGVQETFGIELDLDQALGITTVRDLEVLLANNGA